MGFFDSISSFIEPVIGPLFSSALSLGKDYLSSEVIQRPNADYANDYNTASAKEAFDRTYGAYKTRFQDTAADLRAAGLNPILAAGGGFQVGQGVTAPMPSGNMAQSPVSDFGSSAKALAETAKTEAEVGKTKADTELALKRSMESVAKAYEAREKAGLANTQERKTYQELTNLEANFYKIRHEIDLVKQQVSESGSRSKLNMASAEQMQALTKKVENEKEVLSQTAKEIALKVQALQEINEIYRSPSGAVIGVIRAIMQAVHGR